MQADLDGKTLVAAHRVVADSRAKRMAAAGSPMRAINLVADDLDLLAIALRQQLAKRG